MDNVPGLGERIEECALASPYDRGQAAAQLRR
jgi:hypothetical protein